MNGILLACVLAAAPVDAAPASLADTLDPLIRHFNGGRGRPRFVAVLSSTCPACVFGARAIDRAVLETYPDAGIQVSIVWIDMLPSDNRVAAVKSSAIFDDPRVMQFHDPGREAGRVFAAGLLEKDAGPAWDVYLFYDGDALWEDGPPKPVEWYHQLGGTRRAEPGRFRTGRKLIEALREATGRVVRGEEAAVEVPEAHRMDKAGIPFRGTVLQVEGMGCQGCADAVATALAGLPGVASARVSFETKLAWIGFENDAQVATDALIEAVERCGFKASAPAPSAVLDVPLGLLITSVQVLSRPGCPNAAAMTANLREACGRLGLDCRIDEVNLDALGDDDPRRAWGSPTVLVNGADLMGVERPGTGGPSCRIYSGGVVPGADEIARRLAVCGNR